MNDEEKKAAETKSWLDTMKAESDRQQAAAALAATQQQAAWLIAAMASTQNK